MIGDFIVACLQQLQALCYGRNCRIPNWGWGWLLGEKINQGCEGKNEEKGKGAKGKRLKKGLKRNYKGSEHKNI